jgi:FkbM family methyltransferase
MRSKNSFRAFTSLYSAARSARLLENMWAKRAFADAYFLYKRFWEDPFQGLIQRYPELFKNGDILDIGANIGYTSCLFARAMNPASKVYSFEPDRSNFELLIDVIQRKNLSESIVAMQYAVGSTDGYVKLWHNEKHSGDHRVVTDHFENQVSGSTQISSVPMTSVDAFVNDRNIGKIAFIKIDVQGYELAVCEGMKQTLGAFPEICVCCEYSPESLAELGFDPPRVLDFFRSNGYRIQMLARSSIELARDNAHIHCVTDRTGYVDLLCSRREIV